VNDWAVVEIGSDDSTSRPSLHQALAVRSGRRVLGRRILAGAGSLDAPALRADTQPPTGPSRRRMNARTRLGSSRSCVLACHPPPVFGPTVTRRITTSIGIGGRPEHTNAFPTGDSQRCAQDTTRALRRGMTPGRRAGPHGRVLGLLPAQFVRNRLARTLVSVAWLAGVAAERAILECFRLTHCASGVVARIPTVSGSIASKEGGLSGCRGRLRQICDPLGRLCVDVRLVGNSERLLGESLGELSRARGLAPCLEQISRSRPFVFHRWRAYAQPPEGCQVCV
jgi:hypothetical protein